MQDAGYVNLLLIRDDIMALPYFNGIGFTVVDPILPIDPQRTNERSPVRAT